MTTIIFLLVSCGLLVQGLFIFNRVKIADNKDYLKTYLTIDNSSGVSVLSGNITLLKELNLKITLKIDVFQRYPRNRIVFPVPKVNYCDAVKKLSMPKGVDILIDQFEWSGIELPRCPLKVGFYQFSNFTFDLTRLTMLSMLRFNTSFSYQGILQDENSKVPVLVSKNHVFVTIIP